MLPIITFPNNISVPVLGQGTWQMGVDDNNKKQEIDALQYGLDQGLTLIDTAEMYNDAELIVAEALKRRREEAFVVSKVLPSNASQKGTIRACERSLKRLNIDCLDLYLLHWAGSYPIEETLGAFQLLVKQGKIKNYGVSNFDTKEMIKAWTAPGGDAMITNQVLYNLHHRGIEWDLIPWCREHSLPVMAYSPLNQGRVAPEVLQQIGIRHNANRFQIALAWTLQQEGIISIPKAASRDHIDRNIAAASINLTNEELKQIHRTFPPPKTYTPLEMI